MPFLNLVGRYPDGPGSEETYRRTVNRPAPAVGPNARGQTAVSAQPRLWSQRLLTRRARLHTAGLTTFGLIVLLAIALPFRTMRVAVDGMTIATRSHSVDSSAIVEGAGVHLRPGDSIANQDSDTFVVHRATDVVLSVDGKSYALRAQSDTIEELLAQAGVTIGQDDSVLRNDLYVSPSTSLGSTAPASQQALTIEIRRAVPFTVIENGQQLQLRSSRGTISTALRDAGVRLGAGDEVQPPLGTPLTAGLEVHLQHASELVVTLPGGRSAVYALASTVGEALAGSGITLPPDYRLDPPAETLVSAGLAVHVIGISQQQELETERIQSYVVYTADPSLPAGTQRVVRGQDGVDYRQYTVVYEDGQLVSRALASEWYDPQPANTIIYYSTAPAATAAQTSAGNWRDLVCSYNWDCSWAMAVIMCESGGNPDAYNPQGYVGLFQIWEGYGANLRDPATNIAAAYSLYVSGGRGNWPNCP